MTVEQAASEQGFFSNNAPPKNLAEISAQLLEFLNFHKQNGNYSKKVVVVTSGGTTVPLENNTVRFIDNFSAGTRGSLSAEYFLNHGYLVIFLHREFSLLPFLNHFGHLNFLDLLQLEFSYGKEHENENENAEIVLDQSSVSKLQQKSGLVKILRDYKHHTQHRNYLMIPFTTINEYMFLLRSISEDLKNFYQAQNYKILIYLAAAVSDFFIPQSELPEHKIQSNMAILLDPAYKLKTKAANTANSKTSDDSNDKSGSTTTGQIEISSSTNGKLVLNLDPVPKFLKTIVDSWYNNSFVISFKLETDDSLLIKKCKQALTKYDHQLVIGNLLQSRKDKVVFVNKRLINSALAGGAAGGAVAEGDGRDGKGEKSTFEETWFRLSPAETKGSVSIESIFIPEVIKMHDQWIKDFESK